MIAWGDKQSKHSFSIIPSANSGKIVTRIRKSNPAAQTSRAQSPYPTPRAHYGRM